MVIKTIFVCIFCVVSALYFSSSLFNLKYFFLYLKHCLLVVLHLIFFCAILSNNKKEKQIGNSIYLTILDFVFYVRIHCTFVFDDGDQSVMVLYLLPPKKKDPNLVTSFIVYYNIYSK